MKHLKNIAFAGAALMGSVSISNAVVGVSTVNTAEANQAFINMISPISFANNSSQVLYMYLMLPNGTMGIKVPARSMAFELERLGGHILNGITNLYILTEKNIQDLQKVGVNVANAGEVISVIQKKFRPTGIEKLAPAQSRPLPDWPSLSPAPANLSTAGKHAWTAFDNPSGGVSFAEKVDSYTKAPSVSVGLPGVSVPTSLGDALSLRNSLQTLNRP